MKYINLNISYKEENLDILTDYLLNEAGSDTIFALQEVKAKKEGDFKNCAGQFHEEMLLEKGKTITGKLRDSYHILYSLSYRWPGKHETGNRAMGVMLLVPKTFNIVEAGIFNNCLFPERTLYATIEKDGIQTKLSTFHALTGVSFKLAKAAQFRAMADAIEDYGPDIVSLDANEPKIDHYELSKMEFFSQPGDKEGQGARSFFEVMESMGLKDAYTNFCFEEKKASFDRLIENGEPLSVSHVAGGKNKRYDFVYVRDFFEIKGAEYRFDEGVIKKATDHAAVIVKVNRM